MSTTLKMNPKNSAQQGFSLIQISVMLAVAGIILASTLPGGDLGSDVEKERITREKMAKIESATQNFMASKLRRPCPASGTAAMGSAAFGAEDNTPGRCSGSDFYTQATPLVKTGATTTSSSAIATTLSDTTGLTIGMLVTGTNIEADTHIASVDSATQITLNKYPTGASGDLTFTSVAAGVVPTKTLGLPDDYMFDGYGRRIGYMVDIRATDPGTCRDMQITKTRGSIEILNSATPSFTIDTIDNVMWSLISYGKNGHGAFPMQGSSIANRIDSGASNDDERLNAFVATGTTSFATSFTKKLVKHAQDLTAGNTYFDDLVWTQEASKNSCCTGKMCMLGTRIDGAAAEGLGSNTAIGDINGDGIKDMIFSKSSENKIRVIFGSSTGWTPNSGLSLATANNSRFITINNDSGYTNFATSVAVGDLNDDGYDDIAFAYGVGATSYVKIFYGSANPSTTNTSAITNVITLPVSSSSLIPVIVIGNFSSTTKKDILAITQQAPGIAYVIYGASSYSLTAEAVTTVAASVGFKITSSAPIRFNIGSTAGDFNNDGYGDILFHNASNRISYILFGESPANWDADKTTAATGSTPDIVNLSTRLTAGPTEAVQVTGATASTTISNAVSDMNGDGYNELISNFHTGAISISVLYGKASGSWASPIANNTYDNTNGFRFDNATNRPAYFSNGTNRPVRTGDLNGDGKNDLIFGDQGASVNSLFNSGTGFVVLQPNAGWSSIWSSGTISIFGSIFDSAGIGLPLNNDVSKGYRIDGCAGGDLATVAAIADINNDGINDIIISAYGRNSSAGSIYILFGRRNVAWDAITSLCTLN